MIAPGSRPRLLLVASIAAVLLALWLGARRIAPLVVPAVNAVNALGPIGPFLFICLYIVAMVALVPGAWLTIAGGAVFGVVPAFFYAVAGATLGSTAAFLLGRHAARHLVARSLETAPRLAAIDRAVCAEGRRIVFLLRLSPVSPFNVLNYALGLTTLSLRDFVLASLLGMIPSTVLFAYLGHLAGEALALAEQAQVPKTASYYALLAGGLVATVAASIIVTRAARRALQDV